MDEITAKERIFKKIRDALCDAPSPVVSKVDLDSPVYKPAEESLDVAFAESFVSKGGSFLYCENMDETLENIYTMVHENGWSGKIYCADDVVMQMLSACNVQYSRNPSDAVLKPVVFCGCRYLLAEGGSIVFDSYPSGRRSFFHAGNVVFVASVSQLVPDLKSALHLVRSTDTRNASSLYVWTGRPQILDIYGTGVDGFGPKEICVILVDNL